MRFLGIRLGGVRWGAPLLLALLLTLAGRLVPVRAQQPTDAELKSQDATAEPDERLKKLAPDIKKMLRDAQSLSADDRKKFDDFFDRYYFLQLKVTKDPTKFRKDANSPRTYFAQGKKGPPYDRLNGLTRGMMQKYIAGDFPAPIKYTAVLVLGELNEEEASPPKPWAVAQKDLLTLVTSAKATDAIKMGALVGLGRYADSHGKSPLPADSVTAIIEALLPLVSQSTPPEGRSASGHDWLRQYAIGVLGALGDLGPSQNVLKALAAIVSDPQSAVKTRAAAARALGRLNYGTVKTDGRAIAQALDVLLADGFGGELERAQIRAQDPNKRRVWPYLVDVQTAIKGLRPVVAEGALAQVEARVKVLVQHTEKADWDKVKQELDKIKRPAAAATANKGDAAPTTK